MKYAERLTQLGTETAFEVLDKVNKFPEERKKNVISFGIGEPDFNTPDHIKKAGIEAIKQDYTHYTISAGIIELREAIANFVSKTKKIDITSNNVIVLPGAKFVVDLAILSCTNPGDEIIYPNPGYPIYESLISAHGCKPISAQLLEREEWNYDGNALKEKITEKTKMIIINSPHNPTGSVLTDKNLKVLSEIAIENDIWILSDEIYSNIVYDNLNYTSIANYPEMLERTIILDGFSKFFSMTGWRLGYAIVNTELAEYLARWLTNTISCTATFTQMAGVQAMTKSKEPSLSMVKEFDIRRKLIHRRLNNIEGITALKPKGAFYIFANVTGACERLNLKNSLEFQDFLLEKTDVAVLSRNYFGNKDPSEQEEYIRLSYCISREDINKGMDRIERVLT
ncbi:MAG: pyridoxal phosphate-dependent aminotransferase [Promethearchaeota archaeon]|jgi:aspartate/methionine/tyrosine aminotransferase